MKHIKRRTQTKITPFIRKATQVLYEKMVYYDQRAKTHLSEIINIIQEEKAEGKTRGEAAIYAWKQLQICDDLAIECATKLAPYQSPKLETIEVNKKVEHKYVIRAPAQPRDKEAWMQSVGATDINRLDSIGATILEKEIDREIAQVVRKRQDEQNPRNKSEGMDFDEIDDERRTLN